MIKIYIHGMKNGLYDVDLTVPVKEVEGMFPEFFGDIEVKGNLRIINKRYSFSGTALCDAKLICDISLNEFIEPVSVEININFLADDDLYMSREDEDAKNFEEHVIREDETYIDISREVREELAVHLPMKRIAPEFRGKNFEDIYPQYSAETKKKKGSKNKDVDDRWAPLKNLKIN